MTIWHIAKTTGRETRAVFYLRRNGIEVFCPERHFYFVDKRTKQENHRVSAMFPGYCFFRMERETDLSKVLGSIGVAYVLGERTPHRFIPAIAPEGMVERLTAIGPLIEGKRRKFCNGEKVRVIVGDVSEFIASVEKHVGLKIHVRAVIAGREHKIVVDEKRVMAA